MEAELSFEGVVVLTFTRMDSDGIHLMVMAEVAVSNHFEVVTVVEVEIDKHHPLEHTVIMKPSYS